MNVFTMRTLVTVIIQRLSISVLTGADVGGATRPALFPALMMVKFPCLFIIYKSHRPRDVDELELYIQV